MLAKATIQEASSVEAPTVGEERKQHEVTTVHEPQLLCWTTGAVPRGRLSGAEMQVLFLPDPLVDLH
jgi:hypothetical protein